MCHSVSDHQCSVLLSHFFFFFLMIRRPPRSTHCISSAASDVYKRQFFHFPRNYPSQSLQKHTQPDVWKGQGAFLQQNSTQNLRILNTIVAQHLHYIMLCTGYGSDFRTQQFNPKSPHSTKCITTPNIHSS
eukprot:TRINITY_DN9849_c0_g1_i1.p3 TRINITY_DN9849_c0_g1~~TRINITY_DN9849_c0_g1_i1.p3  ORF type:complete len:131 (-),score=10.74 TRINITY_DN9849_c0_g1_i1:645-1037(-)